MRFISTLAVFGLLVLPVAAQAQGSREACEMIDEVLVQQTLGEDAVIKEQNGAGTRVSFCSWRGADGVGINVHSITAEAQGIAGGTPLEYFMQHQAEQIEQIGSANVAPIDGPWQAAHFVDVTTEPNPQQFFSITLINKDDAVTVDTFGLPKETTVALASAVAGAM